MGLKELSCAESESASSPLPGCGPLRNAGVQSGSSMRQQIFERVRAMGQISRIDLAKDLGVSPGSVTTLTSELIAAGLVAEVEAQSAGPARGRPPVALQIVPEAGYVVGMKIADFTHSAVLVNFAGEVILTIDRPNEHPQMTPEFLISEARALFETLLDDANVDRSKIRGVGVGLAGLVEHDSGRVPWSPNITEADVPLRNLMSVELGVPVHLDNDTNLLTLAELWFGAGRDKPSFVVLSIEYGVGMGLVLDNRLFRGGQGLGLELGHTKVQLDGALCRCGARGCLEAYLADYALVREARVALDMTNDQSATIGSMLETLYDQAKAGNERARTIFNRAGRYLSVALSNVAQLFDPEMIILSGERMRYDYLYADEVMAEMESLSLDRRRPSPPVEIHVWGGYVWARGGAALALDAVTDEIFGAAWAA